MNMIFTDRRAKPGVVPQNTAEYYIIGPAEFLFKPAHRWLGIRSMADLRIHIDPERSILSDGEL